LRFGCALYQLQCEWIDVGGYDMAIGAFGSYEGGQGRAASQLADGVPLRGLVCFEGVSACPGGWPHLRRQEVVFGGINQVNGLCVTPWGVWFAAPERGALDFDS